jgi:hypothetical protein
LDIRDNPLLSKEKYKSLVFHDSSLFVPSTRFRISHADMKGKRPEMVRSHFFLTNFFFKEDVFCIHGNYGDDSRDFIGLFDGHGGTEVDIRVTRYR